jgi:hypothetical protein
LRQLLVGFASVAGGGDAVWGFCFQAHRKTLYLTKNLESKWEVLMAVNSHINLSLRQLLVGLVGKTLSLNQAT